MGKVVVVGNETKREVAMAEIGMVILRADGTVKADLGVAAATYRIRSHPVMWLRWHLKGKHEAKRLIEQANAGGALA